MPGSNLLFISNNFKPKNGFVIGSKSRANNKITYCICNIAQERPLEGCIGTCNHSKLNLHWQSKEINLTQAIPKVELQEEPKTTSIIYDHNIFKNSEDIDTNIGCFKELHSTLHHVQSNWIKVGKSTSSKQSKWIHIFTNYYIVQIALGLHKLLSKLNWFTHLENNIQQLCKEDVRIRRRNLFLSMAIDLILGTCSLYFLLEYRSNVLDSILHSTKFIIDALKQVLNTLMDSPAGLKLNYALNHTLAIFFFYHISLWRAFIESILTVSPNIVYVFAGMGVLGFSYQIQLCADLLMFLTFHVYCIYVYAARFYRVQIYTIASLWRLFIGRKRNPLRGRVDSYQYSHNQLFIGTLGFTILLFLLPTTFLYYIVFTLFRVGVLVACKMLSSIANSLSSLPLYLFYLRIVDSPMIKGSIRIYTKKNSEDSTLELHATLNILQRWFKEPKSSTKKLSETNENNKHSLNSCISNIFSGKLL